MLVCPKCGKRLVREGQSYRCERGHCYDVARQGYTNLLIRKQKQLQILLFISLDLSDLMLIIRKILTHCFSSFCSVSPHP